MKNRAEESASNPTSNAVDWDESLHLFTQIVTCGDAASQMRAILELSRRCKKHAPFSAVVAARFVPLLVDLLNTTSSNNQALQEAAAYSLSRIARRSGGSQQPSPCSAAVGSLLWLLPQSSGSLRMRLVKCLREISVFDAGSRVVIARNGGLEAVMSLLPVCTGMTYRCLLEVLGTLAMLREVRRVLVAHGGLPFLVEAASSGNMASRTRAAHAIGLLGTARRVRHMLVDSGVVPVLVALLQEGDSQAKLTAGNSLGIISSHVDYLRLVVQAGAIPLYVELLEGNEPLGKEIAEDVFCILAVVQENAVLICQHLVRILRGGNDDAKAAAADVLWDLASYKHSHSVSVVRECGAIPLLLELLLEGSEDAREKALGAIVQLSYEEDDRKAMADVGVIPVLIDLLRGDSVELKANAVEALINFSEDQLFHDRVSEVFGFPSFQTMQNRLVRIRASEERMVRSLRQLNFDQFTLDPDFI